METLFAEHQYVILTGGSGLYVRAVLEGMDEMPEVPDSVRGNLIKKHQESGLDPLLQQLQKLDPVYYNQVDKGNPQRIIRALEVSLATGKPYSSFRTSKKIDRPFKTINIGLNRDRSELYARIDARMDTMLQLGLMEEVR